MPSGALRFFRAVGGVSDDFLLAAEAGMGGWEWGGVRKRDETMRADLLAEIHGPTPCGKELGPRGVQVRQGFVQGLELRSGDEPSVALAQRAACAGVGAGEVAVGFRWVYLRARWYCSHRSLVEGGGVCVRTEWRVGPGCIGVASGGSGE